MNTIETYQRVIPRDFFNEAKLLKCMGRLSLHILDCSLPSGIAIEINGEHGDSFDVVLLEDGSLTVINYPVTVNGVGVTMKTTYNSKAEYPLLCELNYEETEVFNADGTFHEDFMARFNPLIHIQNEKPRII